MISLPISANILSDLHSISPVTNHDQHFLPLCTKFSYPLRPCMSLTFNCTICHATMRSSISAFPNVVRAPPPHVSSPSLVFAASVRGRQHSARPPRGARRVRGREDLRHPQRVQGSIRSEETKGRQVAGKKKKFVHFLLS
jgi:hypothetical protein